MGIKKESKGMGIFKRGAILFCLAVVVGATLYFKIHKKEPKLTAVNDTASLSGLPGSEIDPSSQENLRERPAKADPGKALPRLVDLGRGT